MKRLINCVLPDCINKEEVCLLIMAISYSGVRTPTADQYKQFATIGTVGKVSTLTFRGQ